MKKVSAASIPHLTAGAACNDLLSLSSSRTVIPAVEDLIAAVRAGDPARAAAFDAMLAKVPEGFALAPALYVRIPHAKNAALESEYLFSVRQHFLKFLAASQRGALRDLGICEHGIARMARGLDPATADGRRYHVSVDHIIERFGSGRLSDARAPDAARGGAETYPVNHFANLILLPQDVHDLKNSLNAAQGIHDLKDGECRWILMLVPVTSARHHGFVAAPQGEGAAVGRLKLYAPNAAQQVGEASSLTGETAALLQDLRAATSIAKILPMLDALAAQHRPHRVSNDNPRPQKDAEGKPVFDDPASVKNLRRPDTVADLGVALPKDGDAKAGVAVAHRTLRGIFNAAVAHDRAAHRRVERDLRPRLRELRETLAKAHARVEARAAVRQNHPDYQAFVQFFRGRNLRRLCLEAGRYPLPEARDLLQEYRRIEKAIAAREGAAARTQPRKIG